ncbi:MAG: MoxR family ATPase [Candidatus Omnitrophica bacterium]|nr:MoxR family ATPase [Candidatus Omnitrophota bacterium]MDD5771162.1 MoxR family ATPase [Candidatus Omnitrophota bacterium]
MGNEGINKLIANIEKVIVGKTEAVKMLIIGLLTNGHILVEDIPGMGKTMLALTLAKSISADFKRIQATPDLLPTDITGGFVYSPKTGDFDFKRGPVFANILLVDEINRTTPRTQSALLECMQEYKVTVEGLTYALPVPFMTIATQNPIEYQGTYSLPEAQIDRFLMKISIGYPLLAEEVKVISEQKIKHPVESVMPVMTLEDVVGLQDQIKRVQVSSEVLEYIVKLVSSSRKSEVVKQGASPRASIAIMKASCAWAFMEGRDYVIPDDVIKLLPSVLKHRIILHPKAVISGMTPELVIEGILQQIPIS